MARGKEIGGCVEMGKGNKNGEIYNSVNNKNEGKKVNVYAHILNIWMDSPSTFYIGIMLPLVIMKIAIGFFSVKRFNLLWNYFHLVLFLSLPL